MLLNQRLIEQQGLNADEVQVLENLHTERELLFDNMEVCNPKDIDELSQLLYYVEDLERLEFAMQRGWKFEEDKSKHSWWFRAPHCKCPVLDNYDALFGGQRITSSACPLHWVST